MRRPTKPRSKLGLHSVRLVCPRSARCFTTPRRGEVSSCCNRKKTLAVGGKVTDAGGAKSSHASFLVDIWKTGDAGSHRELVKRTLWDSIRGSRPRVLFCVKMKRWSILFSHIPHLNARRRCLTCVGWENNVSRRSRSSSLLRVDLWDGRTILRPECGEDTKQCWRHTAEPSALNGCREVTKTVCSASSTREQKNVNLRPGLGTNGSIRPIGQTS